MSMEIYIVGTHKKRLYAALQMYTSNMHFLWRKKKIIWVPLLSRAIGEMMKIMHVDKQSAYNMLVAIRKLHNF